MGHKVISCKIPIISIGIIAYCRKLVESEWKYHYLMIRRRHSLGFMDFIRGKYSVFQKDYILNLLCEMTVEERTMICTEDFHNLWESIWSHRVERSNQYYHEESMSKEKHALLKKGISNMNYNLEQLVEESYRKCEWVEQEWGFPKGRRNFNEKDLDCGLREFTEETGIPFRYLKNIENLNPFEEVFTGSNYKSYKHKYYVMEIPVEILENVEKTNYDYDRIEVSKIEWKTYDDCINCIRPYNLEKIRLIKNVNDCLVSSLLKSK